MYLKLTRTNHTEYRKIECYGFDDKSLVQGWPFTPKRDKARWEKLYIAYGQGKLWGKPHALPRRLFRHND